MKAYMVNNCYKDGFTIWSGEVIAEDNQTVEEAIINKFGIKKLYNTKNMAYKEIPVNGIHLEHLTVGELLIVLRSVKNETRN